MSDVVGLKSEALLDKVIKEIGNQSIYHRITITDYLDYVKLPCPLDFL